ncbi:YlbF/YmcA family competence regulator [Alkalibacterium iburiense]|uniref:UPF0342 protein GCM10008932_17890 n=1 Tax=Alkalibacterium iburiense TaxID=290589 RepID=A0ABN0XK39_9LACT
MTDSIQEKAVQLEQDIKETEEFNRLKSAFTAVQENEEASQLFNEFRQVQQVFQQKQMMGQKITEEEAQQAQQVSVSIQENTYISELLEAEKNLGQMIDEINQVVLRPVRELYQ